MDDIDETSMCEGSRQSQQDFNYNATGGMSIKKGQVSGTGYNTKKGGRADCWPPGGRKGTACRACRGAA